MAGVQWTLLSYCERNQELGRRRGETIGITPGSVLTYKTVKGVRTGALF